MSIKESNAGPAAIRITAATAAAILLFAWGYNASGATFLGPTAKQAVLPVAKAAAVLLGVVGVIGYVLQLSGTNWLGVKASKPIQEKWDGRKEMACGGALIALSGLVFFIGAYISAVNDDVTNTLPGTIAALVFVLGVFLVIDGLKRKEGKL